MWNPFLQRDIILVENVQRWATKLIIQAPLTNLQSTKSSTPTQPPYRHNLISVQLPHSTRSSSVVILAQPPTSSLLKITDHSFRCASPCLWSLLPIDLCQPRSGTRFSIHD